MKYTPSMKQWLIDNGHCSDGHPEDTYKQMFSVVSAGGDIDNKTFETILRDEYMSSPTAEKMFDRNGNGGDARVKEPSDRYSEKRYTAKNRMGQTVIDPVHQREVTLMSEGSKARAGVLLKHLANKSGLVHTPLTEHESHMLDELANDHPWAGKIGNEWYDKVTGHRNVKALIDDSTSGGLEIAPIEFDEDVITFPLLHGELFPEVDLKPVPRGRRIEGASIGNPTLSWGGGDNTSISLFNTDSLVSAIDTTIFAVDVAIEVGRDFLSDSPVDVGSVLTGLIGERLMEELDKMVANGDGTTQPEGLFQASSVSSINTDNGTSGPPTLSDYITLLFSLGKQYRRRNFRPVFVSNDTTFQRNREIKIDTASPSTDQRAALAPLMSEQFFNQYSTLGWPHKVENNLGNKLAGIAAMAKYRMYRRLGLELRFVEGGKELARNNMMLLVGRARYGGKLMDSSAMAKWTDGQS